MTALKAIIGKPGKIRTAKVMVGRLAIWPIGEEVSAPTKIGQELTGINSE
jgi:hypothetical protein